MSDLGSDRRLLGALLHGVLRKVRERVAEGLAEAGYADIRPAHQAVMMNLGRDGTRISELAERAQITKQSMGALVSYLEGRGYVSIEPDPADRRAKIVRLTARGAGSEQPARASLQRMQAELSQRLDQGELDELLRLLRKLNEVLEDSPRPLA